MFRNFLVATLALTILVTCTTKKPIVVDPRLYSSPDSMYDSVISSFPKFTHFTSNRSRVLLDYEGSLRTLKATISARVDSFTYISLTTPIGQPVAILYFDINNVYFVDHQELTIHQISYINLFKKLRVYLSHREIQNFLFAIPFEDKNTYKSIIHQTSYLVTDYSFEIDYPLNFTNDTVVHSYILSNTYHPQTLILLERALKDSRKRDLVIAKYKWTSKNVSKKLPDMSMIEFSYDGKDVEIDIDYRSVMFDSLTPFVIDTSYNLKILQ